MEGAERRFGHPAAGYGLLPGWWQSSFVTLVSGTWQSHLGHGGSGATTGEMPPWAEAGLAVESPLALGAQPVPEQSRHFHTVRPKI